MRRRLFCSATLTFGVKLKRGKGCNIPRHWPFWMTIAYKGLHHPSILTIWVDPKRDRLHLSTILTIGEWGGVIAWETAPFYNLDLLGGATAWEGLHHSVTLSILEVCTTPQIGSVAPVKCSNSHYFCSPVALIRRRFRPYKCFFVQ